MKYIITVDVNNIEKSGYIKYIPSTPTGNLNLGTFSGTVEVYNIEDELIGLTTFVNGIAQPQTSNSNNRVICYDQVTINEVTCSHGGGHGVGESCNEGYLNDAYWYVSITTICNYDPTTIVQIIDDSSNPSMGGGSSNLNPNNSTLNKIIANLTMAQIDWWYSQNTSQETRDAIVNYVNQNNATQNEEEDAIDFVKELIDDVNQNNLSPQESKDYIISNIIVEQIDDSALDDCTKGILNSLKNLQQEDIAKMIRRFDSPNKFYHITMVKESLPSDPVYGVTLGKFEPIGVIGNTHISGFIKLNENYFTDTKATRLMKANVILHELIHALIYSIITPVNNAPSSQEEFPEIWDTYVNGVFGGNATENQHEFMANHYIDVLSEALQEYDTGVPVANGSQANEIYRDLGSSKNFKLQYFVGC